jgi:hypothetical protein
MGRDEQTPRFVFSLLSIEVLDDVGQMSQPLEGVHKVFLKNENNGVAIVHCTR